MSSSPQAVPIGICSRSLGRSAAGHYLPRILQECAAKGLWTVEIAFECLEGYGKTFEIYSSSPREAIRLAAKNTNRVALELGLVLVALDAFEGYDGSTERDKHEAQLDEFRFWVKLCGIMGIEQIQVPANYGRELASPDLDLIVSDLRELADIGLSVMPPVSIAYEPLGWSTHINTWQKALEVCHNVQRPNIGLCLDTFHVSSLLWGSPEVSVGKRDGGEEALRQSMEELSKISAKDIILFQISDAALLEPPIPESKFTEAHLDPLFAWSMHGRPFPYEGYHPVADICKAVFKTGFRSWTILETFEDETFDAAPETVSRRAEKAVVSWKRLSKECGLAEFHTPVPADRNKLGTCTVNLGDYLYHTLEDKLYVAAAVGHKAIDLYEDDFLHYVTLQPKVNLDDLWEPNAVHLHAAKKIGDLIRALGMEMICFQPLIDVEGLLNENDRQAALKRVNAYFPYMRALRTTVTYITTNRRYDFDQISSNVKDIARDLATFADLAAEYAKKDGGPMLYIGYEHLSWGSIINTFDKTWEAIAQADRPNLGFVFDSFNFLAVEYADPYNPSGHGRIYSTPEKSLKVVRERLAKMVKLIPGDKIYVCQVADAELVDPKSLPVVTPASEPWSENHEPPHRFWSTGHRLFPNEPHKGGYMPVADCLAAILATGYKGAFTLEIFNDSIHSPGRHVLEEHARRSYDGVAACVEEAKAMKPFW